MRRSNPAARFLPCQLTIAALPVERADSRALYYSDELNGRAGNWVDGTAPHRARRTSTDEDPHLAKVRVAGSNPVFRSNGPGQGRFSTPNS